MARKPSAFERRIARALKGWNDPHDQRPYPELDTVQRLEILTDGEVNLTVRPMRPHCPCCLLDLEALRRHLSGVKGARFVHIEVVDIPGAPRWTRAINR